MAILLLTPLVVQRRRERSVEVDVNNRLTDGPTTWWVAGTSGHDRWADQASGRGVLEGGVDLGQGKALIHEIPERPGSPMAGDEVEGLEIGRASCRERV